MQHQLNYSAEASFQQIKLFIIINILKPQHHDPDNHEVFTRHLFAYKNHQKLKSESLLANFCSFFFSLFGVFFRFFYSCRHTRFSYEVFCVWRKNNSKNTEIMLRLIYKKNSVKLKAFSSSIISNLFYLIYSKLLSFVKILLKMVVNKFPAYFVELVCEIWTRFF